ncbi:carboxymuconolactone decarboxylase family protein [Cellulosimicrobium sp. CpK407]|uniref:carboxymuconolactone decarboxylase family protein n=1 Tax=Cellulosimicrobium sp. CpK407 TaxID=3229847 RepID=UPI003F3E5D18
MDGVHFINTRFDPDQTRLHDIAKDMAANFGFTATLSIDPRLAQLLRLRVAQLNPCSYCLILHSRAAHDVGMSSAKVAHLASWRESTLFTEQEAAALAYAEALTVFDQPAFASAHAQATDLFDEHAVAEIAAVVINMNVWTRLKLAQGATPVDGSPDSSSG